MPHLEAPADLNDSSPDHSMHLELPELPVADVRGNRMQLLAPRIEIPIPIPMQPVAAAQLIRIPTPTIHLELNRSVDEENQRNRNRSLNRNNSFDRDIQETEEENHFPAYVHLLPVVLPPQSQVEPTLDELLRRVTQRNDLHNVETVRLRVISYTMSLSHISLFLPRLQHLDLSGSVLCTLRDLGYGLINLIHLNVSNCGLNSLDGTGGFPSLRQLTADDNMIQRIGSLNDLPLLQRLSVRHNRISELRMLTLLGSGGNLAEIDLLGNPVCHQQNYRQTLQRSISTLRLLDGLPVEQMEVTEGESSTHNTTDSEDVSSLSSTSSYNINASAPANYRPATAPISVHHHEDNMNSCSYVVSTSAQQRPNSVSTPFSRRSSLSSGSPVMGSVLAVARQKTLRNRTSRGIHKSNAWMSSSSSSDSFSSARSTRPPSSLSSNSGSFDLSPMQATRK